MSLFLVVFFSFLVIRQVAIYLSNHLRSCHSGIIHPKRVTNTILRVSFFGFDCSCHQTLTTLLVEVTNHRPPQDPENVCNKKQHPMICLTYRRCYTHKSTTTSYIQLC